jgi:hypothetical protein
MKFSTAAIAVAAIAGASAQNYNATVVLTATSDVVVASTIIETITSCTGSNVVSCHYVSSTPTAAAVATTTAPAVVAPVVTGTGLNVTAPGNASNISTIIHTAGVTTTSLLAEVNGAGMLSGSVLGAVAVAGVALLL